MFTENEKFTSFVASGDLSLLQNRLVAALPVNFKLGAAGGSNALAPIGVLSNAPRDGENASVVTGGTTMVRVGAAVAAGAYVTSAASGWGITAVQGAEATKNYVGRALTAAASGMLAAVKVQPGVLSNSVA